MTVCNSGCFTRTSSSVQIQTCQLCDLTPSPESWVVGSRTHQEGRRETPETSPSASVRRNTGRGGTSRTIVGDASLWKPRCFFYLRYRKFITVGTHLVWVGTPRVFDRKREGSKVGILLVVRGSVRRWGVYIRARVCVCVWGVRQNSYPPLKGTPNDVYISSSFHTLFPLQCVRICVWCVLPSPHKHSPCGGVFV